MALSDQIRLIISPLLIRLKITKLPSDRYLTLILKTLDPHNPLFKHELELPENNDILPSI